MSQTQTIHFNMNYCDSGSSIDFWRSSGKKVGAILLYGFYRKSDSVICLSERQTVPESTISVLKSESEACFGFHVYSLQVILRA